VTGVEGFYLTNFADSFTADAASIFVYGFAGNDAITGSDQSDFIDGGAGADVINGGGGFDYLSYNSSSSAVTVNLNAPAANTGDVAGDTVTNVEAYILTEQNDTFVGLSSGQNIIFGYGGNDVLIGGFNANNWLFGGNGNDRLVGGGISDLFSGDSGADTIVLSTSNPIAGSSVLGFEVGIDSVEISRAIFGLAPGYQLTAGTTFLSGAAPVETLVTPTFIYYSDSGLFYFDLDGAGSTAATLLLQFSGNPALGIGDFQLV
jgi:serralysin